MQKKRTATLFYATLAILICLTATTDSAWPQSSAAMSVPSESSLLKNVSGRWYTEGREGGVELYPCEDKICGRFSWMKRDMENGDMSRDVQNPDRSMRSRPLCHMQFMGNFTPESPNRYTGGWIYSPRDGGIYSAQMTLVDHDTLDLHGYLFFPFLGQSQIWKRAETMPSCLGEKNNEH